jgi:trk system potassium uptake protein TrkA
VSSNDEANLVASRMAKDMGASRCVVRVGIAEEVITDRRLIERLYGVDLLLSTQLLTTIRLINQIRGHDTMDVEYLAGGRVQLRKIHLGEDSPLTRKPLRDLKLPDGSLVAAIFHGDQLTIPAGNDRADPGDDALILGKTEVIARTERMLSSSREYLGTVVLAGCGGTGTAVAQALEGLEVEVKIIERDRRRAAELAAQFPRYEILHGESTDIALLRSERIEKAQSFAALSGNDESNLMASLMAQELGVPQVMALVQRSETSELWQHLGLQLVLSPRALAYQRIKSYIDSGYSPNIVSLRHGAAQVMERKLAPASPAAGVTLADISPPRGVIVGAVVRKDRVFVPGGDDRLEVGDLVILFVQQDEIETVNLLFPGREDDLR